MRLPRRRIRLKVRIEARQPRPRFPRATQVDQAPQLVEIIAEMGSGSGVLWRNIRKTRVETVHGEPRQRRNENINRNSGIEGFLPEGFV